MSDTRTALIIGAGPGLGEAVARRFADTGWTVGLTARTADRVETLADTLTADTDGRGVPAPGDVTDGDDVAVVIETVPDAAGSIDVLVYTVYGSGTGHKSFADTGVEDMRHGYWTELEGLFRVAKQVVPAMRDRGDGAILATGSVLSTAGERGAPRSISGRPATTWTRSGDSVTALPWRHPPSGVGSAGTARCETALALGPPPV